MPTLMAATKSLIGRGGQCSGVDQALQREAERDEGSGDGSGARASVGLDHVAINPDGALAEMLQIGNRAQRAADEPLNFLGASALLALGRLRARYGSG